MGVPSSVLNTSGDGDVVGRSLTGRTVRVAVCTSPLTVPSLLTALKVKLVAPRKSAAGLKVKLPSGDTLTLPSAAGGPATRVALL
jgi:hypothetical protein